MSADRTATHGPATADRTAALEPATADRTAAHAAWLARTGTVTAPPVGAHAAEDGKPWQQDAAWLQANTNAALARLGRTVRVAVTVLGVRDELRADEPRRPGLPVAFDGRYVLAGPVSGCARCLATRWQTIRTAALREALERGGPVTAVGRSPLLTPFLADTLAALVAQAKEPATVHQLDAATLRVQGYPLLPDDGCRRCAAPVDDSAETARLTLEPVAAAPGEQFRHRPLASYALPQDAFTNPVCGALGVHTYLDYASVTTAAVSGVFAGRGGNYLQELYWGGHADSYERSAQVGVFEGLERYAGMRPLARRTTVHASYEQLGGRAVDPASCGLYGEEFHEVNPQAVRYRPDLVMPWVWGHSLRDDRPVLVPELLVYYHGGTSMADRFVQDNSNGCASGGSLAEAAYFGLMEVIERDAFLLMWYTGTAAPAIDPATLPDRASRQMIDRLRLYGYETRLLDLRVTFDVPVVGAMAYRPDGGPGTVCFGAGASLDPAAAARAALCEIATDATKLRRRLAEDPANFAAMAGAFDRVISLKDHPIAFAVPEMAAHADFLRHDGPQRPIGELAPAVPRSADLTAQLASVVGEVAGHGFDVVVVDQSLPQQRRWDLHTVSVLVPGLLPIDFGWRRQRALHMPRLRTAHRRAGLRETDLTEAELHLVPHPFP